MNAPVVSVIIPTAGRPQWLPRAVSSSLAGMPEGSVEVVVVPNGPDTSWQHALAPWLDCQHVRVYALPKPNQNTARNLGLSQARGQLVRFLDDDDYLLPDGAVAQYEAMSDQSIDVCSGHAERVDQDEALLGRLSLPPTPDFTLASLQRDRLQLPFAHVYRRTSLKSIRWPVDILRSEDIVFLIRYAVGAPRKWAKINRPVGVWYQHDRPRMSLDRPDSSVHETTAEELLASCDALKSKDRMSPDVQRVIAESLWQCVQQGFYLRPAYWTQVARKTLKIDADSRPDTSLFKNALLRSLNPILVLWTALPTRLARYAYRLLRARIFGWDYRRTL